MDDEPHLLGDGVGTGRHAAETRVREGEEAGQDRKS